MLITKGFIKSSLENKEGALKYAVQLPIFENASITALNSAYKEYVYATVACSPHMTPNYKSGDIVFVAFEDYDLGKPVIVGHLFGAKCAAGGNECTTYIDLDVSSLKVLSAVCLPKTIKYLEKKSDSESANEVNIDLSKLKNLKDPVQSQINDLVTKVNGLVEKYVELENKISQLQTIIDDNADDGYKGSDNYVPDVPDSSPNIVEILSDAVTSILNSISGQLIRGDIIDID